MDTTLPVTLRYNFIRRQIALAIASYKERNCLRLPIESLPTAPYYYKTNFALPNSTTT